MLEGKDTGTARWVCGKRAKAQFGKKMYERLIR